MPDTLERTWKRWFQFRLSTWLVLIAIMAWAMALRPRAYLICSTTWTLYATFGTRLDDDATWTFQFSGNSSGENTFFAVGLEISPFPSILYPALALVAFTAWKLFQLRRIRRRQQEMHAPTSG